MKKLLAKILLAGMMGSAAFALQSCTDETDEPNDDSSDVPGIEEQLGLEDPETDYSNEGTLQMGQLTASVPTDWIGERPTNTMRIAQYSLSGDSDTRVYIYKFAKGDDNPMMGSMEDSKANIERWKGEFTEAKNVETKKYDNGALSFSAEGTFKKKKHMGADEYTELPDYMTLTALIPTDDAVYSFRLSGPRQEVQPQRDKFMAMIESIKKN